MLVPQRFVVPEDDLIWPEKTWGLKLGRVVTNIRLEKGYVKNRADLESIGFNYDPQILHRRYNLVKVALQTYEDLYGDMLVPGGFVVPANDMIWPEETWDMNLGMVVTDIRRGRSYLDKRADLEGIGFDFHSQRTRYMFKSIQVALVKYKDINGDMLAPHSFVVPVDDITWPEETRGMKLGKVVNNIRRGKCYVDKRTDLESIGFDFNPQK
jgi:hypothetical protein